jgi:hypothetical protein
VVDSKSGSQSRSSARSIARWRWKASRSAKSSSNICYKEEGERKGHILWREKMERKKLMTWHPTCTTYNIT